MFYVVKQNEILNRAFLLIEDAEEYIKIFKDRSQCSCHNCKYVCEMYDKYGGRLPIPYDIIEIPDATHYEDGNNLFILFKNKKVISTATSYKTIHDDFKQNIRYKDYILGNNKYKIVFCPLSTEYDSNKHYEYNTDYRLTIYEGDDEKDNYLVNNEL